MGRRGRPVHGDARLPRRPRRRDAGDGRCHAPRRAPRDADRATARLRAKRPRGEPLHELLGLGPAGRTCCGFIETTAAAIAEPPLGRLEVERGILLTEAATGGSGPVAAAMALRFGAAGHGLVGHDELGLASLDGDAAAGWIERTFTIENAALWMTGRPPSRLDLPLPRGRAASRRRSRSALADLVTPACFTIGPFGVVHASLVGRRSAALATGFQIAVERAWQILRWELGHAYEISDSFDPLGPRLGGARPRGRGPRAERPRCPDSPLGTAPPARRARDRRAPSLRPRRRRRARPSTTPRRSPGSSTTPRARRPSEGTFQLRGAARSSPRGARAGLRSRTPSRRHSTRCFSSCRPTSTLPRASREYPLSSTVPDRGPGSSPASRRCRSGALGPPDAPRRGRRGRSPTRTRTASVGGAVRGLRGAPALRGRRRGRSGPVTASGSTSIPDAWVAGKEVVRLLDETGSC